MYQTMYFLKADIKKGLLVQGTFTSLFQKQINNLDLSPDLDEPSYEIASPLKYVVFSFANQRSWLWSTYCCQKDKRNVVKTVKTFTRFSLYLGARFYFDLKLISAFCKFLVIIIIFFLFISEKFIYLYIYSFIYLDFQRIKTYLIGLYPPRLTLLFAVSAVCEFSSKTMNRLDRFVCDLCSVMARRQLRRSWSLLNIL